MKWYKKVKWYEWVFLLFVMTALFPIGTIAGPLVLWADLKERKCPGT